MISFRSRARRLAFGEAGEHTHGSEASSTRSSSRSRSSRRSSSSRSPSRRLFNHSSSISEPCSCGGTGKPSDKSVQIAPRRTNRVRKIHRSEPFELFVEALEQDGCVIVKDFVNPQIATQVQSAENVDLNDYEEERGREAPLDVNALIRESLLNDSLYQTLSTHFLTLETISWNSKKINMSISKPRLFRSSTQDLNNATPEDIAATFHRADSSLHQRHNASIRYDYQSRRDTTLGLLVPELDSLSASIPIRVIPGSHLWDDQKPDISRGVKDIQLKGGDAMILLGSIYHALGDEESQKPTLSRSSSASGNVNGNGSGCASFKEKLLHDMWMCTGIYRAEGDITQDDNDDDNYA